MGEDTGRAERYTIPPEARVTSQEKGLSKWESILSREEVENWEGVFGSPYHKPAHKGGGEAAVDTILEHPEQVSPEAIILFEEFVWKKGHSVPPGQLKSAFLSWLSDDYEEEFRRPRPEHFTPTELVLDPHEGSFDVYDLKKLWSNPKTKVSYFYHPRGKGGHLIFEGELDSGEKRKIKVELGELARAAFGRKIFFGSPQTDEERQVFVNKMKSLTIDDKKMAAPDIKFAYPIELSLNRRAAERKLTRAMAKRVTRFDYAWRKGGQVSSIGFGFRKGAIDNVALELETGQGKRILALPFDVFRTAYGVSRFSGKENGRYSEGGDFGGIATLCPATPTETFLDIASSLSIGGSHLPPRTRVLVAEFPHGKPAVSATIGYT